MTPEFCKNKKVNALPVSFDPYMLIRVLEKQPINGGCDYIAFGPSTYEARKIMVDIDSSLPYITNYPESWIALYKEKNYVDIDPVLNYAKTESKLFVWKDLKNLPNLPSKIKTFWRESEEHGLRCGVTVPLHGPKNKNFLFSVASSNPTICSACFHQEEIQLIAYQFYLAYINVNSCNDKEADIELTKREKEVMHWTVQGKSAWDISAILNISEHTVNFHLKNITKKLNVTNKAAASAKAVRLGLISL